MCHADGRLVARALFSLQTGQLPRMMATSRNARWAVGTGVIPRTACVAQPGPHDGHEVPWGGRELDGRGDHCGKALETPCKARIVAEGKYVLYCNKKSSPSHVPAMGVQSARGFHSYAAWAGT